jgi:hypothetical protein
MKMNRRRNKEEMRKLVSQWKTSELTRKEFSQQNNIAETKLGYWQKKFKKTETPKQFIPLVVREKEYDINIPLEIHYPNGVKIKSLQKLDIPTIKELVTII